MVQATSRRDSQADVGETGACSPRMPRGPGVKPPSSRPRACARGRTVADIDATGCTRSRPGRVHLTTGSSIGQTPQFGPDDTR
jgi:hypothetical protein